MSNLLVTGGAGFIGSCLVDNLIKDGHQVFVIDNMSTGLKENLNPEATYFFEDISNYINNSKKLSEIIKNNAIETVFHLAALTDVETSMRKPMECFNVNLIASISLYEICRSEKVKKFIFSSTSAVYGVPKEIPVLECHPLDPISPYGASKLAFEQYIGLDSKSKMQPIIFRLANVFGPRQRPDLEGGVIAIFHNLISDNKDIKFYGDGEQTRDWVHVKDITSAFIAAHKTDLSEKIIMNLGSKIGHTLWEAFYLIAEKFSYTKSPIISPKRKGDIKHMQLSGDKAKELIGWEPTIDLHEGIRLL